MFKFFSDAFKEIGHVVWPTPKETRKYMNYNIIIIVVMTIFLSLAGYVFRTSLQTAKNVINPNSMAQFQATQQAEQSAALEDVYKNFGLSTDNIQIESTPATEGEVQTTETVTTENTENIVLPSEAEETQEAQAE